jgi:hypothetical protein
MRPAFLEKFERYGFQLHTNLFNVPVPAAAVAGGRR